MKKGYLIELNASVVTEDTLEYLKANGADFSNFRVNSLLKLNLQFYPKPNYNICLSNH